MDFFFKPIFVKTFIKYKDIQISQIPYFKSMQVVEWDPPYVSQ